MTSIKRRACVRLVRYDEECTFFYFYFFIQPSARFTVQRLLDPALSPYFASCKEVVALNHIAVFECKHLNSPYKLVNVK